MHPPGQAMNSMKWHSLKRPPRLMSSMTLCALAVPWATATFRVAPRSHSQSAKSGLRMAGTGPTWPMGCSAYRIPCSHTIWYSKLEITPSIRSNVNLLSNR